MIVRLPTFPDEWTANDEDWTENASAWDISELQDEFVTRVEETQAMRAS